jgi:hypothetical protein
LRYRATFAPILGMLAQPLTEGSASAQITEHASVNYTRTPTEEKKWEERVKALPAAERAEAEALETVRPEAEAKLAQLQERAALAREVQLETMQARRETAQEQARARALSRDKDLDRAWSVRKWHAWRWVSLWLGREWGRLRGGAACRRLSRPAGGQSKKEALAMSWEQEDALRRKVREARERHAFKESITSVLSAKEAQGAILTQREAGQAKLDQKKAERERQRVARAEVAKADQRQKESSRIIRHVRDGRPESER